MQRWRAFVRATSVVRAGAARDAAQKLGILGGAQSPLLATLALVARNTAVDSGMAAAFQPVHAVTPPGPPDRFVSEANQQYVNGLVGLQAALEQVTNMPPIVDTASAQAVAQAAQQALGSAAQAKVAARQLAQKFAVDTAAVQVGPAGGGVAPRADRRRRERAQDARRDAPTLGAEAGGRGGGWSGGGGGGGGEAGEEAQTLAAILNERGRALCAAMTPMLAKFPFSADASAEASIGDVAAMLAPGTGALWAFHQERLDPLMEKQGAQWVAKPGAPVALSAPFLAFFNRAAAVSAALFGGAPRAARRAHGARHRDAAGLAHHALTRELRCPLHP